MPSTQTTAFVMEGQREGTLYLTNSPERYVIFLIGERDHSFRVVFGNRKQILQNVHHLGNIMLVRTATRKTHSMHKLIKINTGLEKYTGKNNAPKETLHMLASLNLSASWLSAIIPSYF